MPAVPTPRNSGPAPGPSPDPHAPAPENGHPPAQHPGQQQGQHQGASPHAEFDRDTWSGLRANPPLPLTQADLDRLSGLLAPVDLDEVEQVYLPLSRLVGLYVAGVEGLHAAT